MIELSDVVSLGSYHIGAFAVGWALSGLMYAFRRATWMSSK